MCGRFVSSSPPDELAKYFDVEAVAETVFEPNYNVAPSLDVFVVVETGGLRRLDSFRWGLVPFWAKDPTTGNKMINARAEGLAEKNAYRTAFEHKRCIVPADGFYEWRKIPGQKVKQPYFIQRTDGQPLAFAGLWEEWRGPDKKRGEALRSATIITTTPNELLATIHDRMPVILPPSVWDEWLDPDNADLDLLGKLLVPAPASVLTMHPVSTEVNNVRNQGAHLADLVEPDPPVPQLLPEDPAG